MSEDHGTEIAGPESAGQWLAKAQVLHVDDSRVMRAMLKKALVEIGFENVVEAVDGLGHGDMQRR